MNQKFALFNRVLLASALSLAAACLCAAQQTPAETKGAAPPPQQQATTDKTAAATDKEKPAAATALTALDEELAKTPAGKTVAKFFAAFNSGDLKQMRAFHEAYGGDTENADKDLEFYERTGGLKLHSVTSAAKDAVSVLAQSKKDARWLTFNFTLGAEPPHAINGISVRPATAPAN